MPQFRDVPLKIADLKEIQSFHFVVSCFKNFIEGFIGHLYAHIRAQKKKRFINGLHNGLGIVNRFSQLIIPPFQFFIDGVEFLI